MGANLLSPYGHTLLVPSIQTINVRCAWKCSQEIPRRINYTSQKADLVLKVYHYFKKFGIENYTTIALCQAPTPLHYSVCGFLRRQSPLAGQYARKRDFYVVLIRQDQSADTCVHLSHTKSPYTGRQSQYMG